MKKGIALDTWPGSLKEFITLAFELSMKRAPRITESELEVHFSRGMRPKKIHETSMLTPLIARMASSMKANQVVDFGSGVGYLGQVVELWCIIILLLY